MLFFSPLLIFVKYDHKSHFLVVVGFSPPPQHKYKFFWVSLFVHTSIQKQFQLLKFSTTKFCFILTRMELVRHLWGNQLPTAGSTQPDPKPGKNWVDCNVWEKLSNIYISCGRILMAFLIVIIFHSHRMVHIDDDDGTNVVTHFWCLISILLVSVGKPCWGNSTTSKST